MSSTAAIKLYATLLCMERLFGLALPQDHFISRNSAKAADDKERGWLAYNYVDSVIYLDLSTHGEEESLATHLAFNFGCLKPCFNPLQLQTHRTPGPGKPAHLMDGI
jgi:hypothetical protein